MNETVQKKSKNPRQINNETMNQTLYDVWKELPAAKLHISVISIPERIEVVL